MKVMMQAVTQLPKDQSMGVDVAKVGLSVAFTVLPDEANEAVMIL